MRRLILRPGAIGDCILALPAMQSLAADYTEIWISAPLVPLIRCAQRVRPLAATGIDLVGVGDLEFPDALKEKLRSFDSIVSWYGSNRPEFRKALLGLGVRCEFLAALPPEDYAGHAAQFFARQVGAPENVSPRIEVHRGAARDAVAIHPFSGSKKKNWSLTRYQALAAIIGMERVEWLAGPEEELAGASRFEDLARLAEWLSGARLYIGNDSGITHLAAAIGVPTLALFGPTDPMKWGPAGPNVTIVRSRQIEDLSVDLVMRVVNRQLSLPSKDSSST